MRWSGAATVLFASACGHEEARSTDPVEPEVAITLSFAARVGDAPFACTSPATGMGTTGATVEPLDFRLYVHDVRLVSADGRDVPFHLANDGKWQHGGVALLDFEDKTGTCVNGTVDTNTVLHGSAPAGVYVGLKLRIGVPASLNHADAATAESPLNLSGLFWGWNAGYKFVRIDGRASAASRDAPSMEANAFNIHLGSTHCHSNGSAITGCDRPDVGEVELHDLDPTTKTILVDYAALVMGTDLTRDLGGAPGCMSDDDDPECPTIFAHLGVNPATGKPDATQQALFRVE